MGFKLRGMQQDAYDFAVDREATALYCEQRTGKTYVTMALIRKLGGSPINLTTGEGNDFCGLLICLLNNRDSTWRDKLSENLKWLNVSSDWEEFKKLPSPRLFLIHFDILPKMINQLARYKKFNWACIDEAQGIANRGTKQSRAAARLSWVDRRLILTGTPIDKRPTELWAQFRFLDPDVFSRNWAKFEEEYLDFAKVDMSGIRPGTPQWEKKILQQRILKSKAEFDESKMPKFAALIEPYVFRLTKEDMDIKRADIHQVIVPLTSRQRRYYQEMKHESVVELDNGTTVIAPLVITQIMKERQLASGFIYDEDEELHHVGRSKLRKLLKMIDELSKPIVVFTAFRPDNDLIESRLRDEGYEVIAVHGKIPKKKRPDIWRQFQKAQYDVIVCQIKTGGVGVDLWKANNAIVHSMGHSFRDFDQAMSRLDSIDKEKSSQIFVLCAENTVDVELYDLVIQKGLNAQQLYKQLKRSRSWQKKKPQRPRRTRNRKRTTTRTSSR